MLDTILEQIKNALDSNQTIQIDASPNRFGFTRDGLNYQIGLHGFREWWVLENCMITLQRARLCDFHYTNFDTLHVIPRPARYSKKGVRPINKEIDRQCHDTH